MPEESLTQDASEAVHALPSAGSASSSARIAQQGQQHVLATTAWNWAGRIIATTATLTMDSRKRRMGW